MRLAPVTDLSALNHPISQTWKLRPRKGTLPSPRSHVSGAAGNRALAAQCLLVTSTQGENPETGEEH